MKLSPRKARSDQFLKLNSDNKHTQNYWILLNEDYITIAKQTSGESCTQEILLKVKMLLNFNYMIDTTKTYERLAELLTAIDVELNQKKPDLMVIHRTLWKVANRIEHLRKIEIKNAE